MKIPSYLPSQRPATAKPASRADLDNFEKEYYAPVAPSKPVEPLPPFMVKVERFAARTSWLAGAGLAAGVGVAGAKLAGGWLGRSAGIATGLLSVPVGAGAGAIALGLTTLPLNWMGWDEAPLWGAGLGALAGGIAAPVGGWFLGGSELGTWATVGISVAAAVGGGIGGFLLGESLDYGPAQRKFDDKMYAFRDQMRAYDKEFALYQKEKTEYYARQARDPNLDISLEDDFISVGDYDVERK